MTDFIENIPDKSIILDIPGDEPINWNMTQVYNEKFKEFHVALHNLNRYDEFNSHNVKWYWPYPITSYYELNAIADLGPSYLLIGPPLSFQLEKVKKISKNIPLRLIPTSANPDYLPLIETKNNIKGQWIRPEDIPAYEPYISVFEFDEYHLNQEEALLHIYKENGYWMGNLNLLIKNLQFNVDNRSIPEDFGKTRANCGQKCMSDGACHLCELVLAFAENIRKEKIERKKQSNIDNN